MLKAIHALYGYETWRLTKWDEAKPDTFLHKCLRRLLEIYWPLKVSNEEVRRRSRTCTISELIRKWRCRWIGHVLRMNNQQNPRIALTWAPEGKRTRGRSKVTWRRTVEGEMQKMGFSHPERSCYRCKRQSVPTFPEET